MIMTTMIVNDTDDDDHERMMIDEEEDDKDDDDAEGVVPCPMSLTCTELHYEPQVVTCLIPL